MALISGKGKEHKVYHYQLDHIGTPTDLTNTEGKTVWSAQYLAYGTIYTQHVEEVTKPLRFQGQYFDQETGLHYNRHRYYNPKSGLFTTADPIGLAGGLNNYQYVKNPIGFVDPLGLADVPMVGGGCGGKNGSGKSDESPSPDEVEAPKVVAKGLLDWGGVDRDGLSRKDHVRRHGTDNPNRNVEHGVFSENPINQTTEAWKQAKETGLQPRFEYGKRIYEIPSPNAGVQGGNPSKLGHGQTLNTIRIVMETNSNRVISAYPVKI